MACVWREECRYCWVQTSENSLGTYRLVLEIHIKQAGRGPSDGRGRRSFGGGPSRIKASCSGPICQYVDWEGCANCMHKFAPQLRKCRNVVSRRTRVGAPILSGRHGGGMRRRRGLSRISTFTEQFRVGRVQSKVIDRVVSINHNDRKVLFGHQQVKKHWEVYFQALMNYEIDGSEDLGDVVG